MDEREQQRRPEGEEDRPSPPWVWAVLVAFALVAVTAGAIVGMVAAGAREAVGTAPGSDAAATGAAPTVLPPTLPIPPATDIPDTGSFETFPPIETIPTETTAPPPEGLIEWPAGTSGYTVILSSTPVAQGESIPNARAQQAISAGLPSVGILDSSEFRSLRPGYLVVFSGVYTSLEEAQRAVPRARAAGFASAYSRTVAP